jgi:hypothetical protein
MVIQCVSNANMRSTIFCYMTLTATVPGYQTAVLSRIVYDEAKISGRELLIAQCYFTGCDTVYFQDIGGMFLSNVSIHRKG